MWSSRGSVYQLNGSGNLWMAAAAETGLKQPSEACFKAFWGLNRQAILGKPGKMDNPGKLARHDGMDEQAWLDGA